MARARDPNSAGSQFFICFKDCSFLDGQYTAFGQVVDGADVVRNIEKVVDTDANDRPKKPVELKKVTIAEKKK